MAVDASAKANFLFEIQSFVASAPRKSVIDLMKRLAKTTAKHKFKSYVDGDPKYSAAGKAGVQYSWFGTEWRTHCRMRSNGVDDQSLLTSFLTR